jgi:hypothetical protein
MLQSELCIAFCMSGQSIREGLIALYLPAVKSKVIFAEKSLLDYAKGHGKLSLIINLLEEYNEKSDDDLNNHIGIPKITTALSLENVH